MEEIKKIFFFQVLTFISTLPNDDFFPAVSNQKRWCRIFISVLDEFLNEVSESLEI